MTSGAATAARDGAKVAEPPKRKRRKAVAFRSNVQRGAKRV